MYKTHLLFAVISRKSYLYLFIPMKHVNNNKNAIICHIIYKDIIIKSVSVFILS